MYDEIKLTSEIIRRFQSFGYIIDDVCTYRRMYIENSNITYLNFLNIGIDVIGDLSNGLTKQILGDLIHIKENYYISTEPHINGVYIDIKYKTYSNTSEYEISLLLTNLLNDIPE